MPYMILIIVSLYASFAFAQDSTSPCPTGEDLERGIMYGRPARTGMLYQRHHRLDKHLIGTNDVNGIFADGMTVSYAGLFTHKHWKNHRITQYEAPLTDMTELLRFEVGTKHGFESVRFNPQEPDRQWKVKATYHIKPSEPFSLGDCVYHTVSIFRLGTLTYPNGKVTVDRQNYLFIPELLLNVGKRNRSFTEQFTYYGDVSVVKKIDATDQKTWPFTADAQSVLH